MKYIIDEMALSKCAFLNRLKHPLDATAANPVSVPAFGFINQLKLTPVYSEFEVSDC